MIQELQQRFGTENVSVYKKVSDRLDILQLDLNEQSAITILVTCGFSNYKMPVHPRHEGQEYNELFFCIPKYWDLDEKDNPNRQWPVEWLEKLTNHAIEKETWYGPGHTIQCYSDYRSLSDLMKQNHLMLIEPILLKKEMAPISIGEKTVYFLAGMPIFGEEMDFKQGKGTYKLMTKFLNKNHNEKLDDYRESVLRSRVRLWR
ncbi:MAG: suppressor of fused domain protein [Crocinitomicaceae bacterium]